MRVKEGMNKIMRLWTKMAFLLLLVPVFASAQYKDLDAAMSSLTRGFGSGDVQAVVAGIGEGEQVMLEFPGMVDKRGFFGRDQAVYVLDEVFNKAKPTAFEQRSARKVSAEAQYQITARWTVEPAGEGEVRELYITLREKNDRWSVASIRSSSK
jgi:hypothetical protein